MSGVMLCSFGLLTLAILGSVEAAGVYTTDHFKEVRPLEGFNVWSASDALKTTGLVQGNLAGILNEENIQLEFDAFGEHFTYSLSRTRNTPTFHKVETNEHGEDKIEIVKGSNSNYATFTSDLTKQNRIAATVFKDGSVHAVLHKNGNDYQIDRASKHKATMQEQHYAELLAESSEYASGGEGHTIVKILHNTRIAQGSCGVTKGSKYNDIHHGERSNLTSTHIHDHDNHDHHHHHIDVDIEAPEHLRRLLAVERWTNCFPNDSVERKLSIGLVVDLGAYQNFGSDDAKVESEMATLINNCNYVYVTQMNIRLFIESVVIIKTTSRSNSVLGSGPFNQGGSLGCLEIDDALNKFSTWRNSYTQGKYGLWHHVTNCHAPPGTVGLAWLGVIAALPGSYWSSTGISHYSSTSDWGTVAHEIGHNFGGDHSFEEGQGSTGGIMDYGDGTLNGEFQFNTRYRKTQMCAHITDSMNSEGSPGKVAKGQAWNVYEAVCGNGLVDEGEECDDAGDNGQSARSCCSSTCQLVSGATCNGGECCYAPGTAKACTVKSSLDSCAGETGFCRNGECETAVICNYYSNTALEGCGPSAFGGCTFKCNWGTPGECGNVSGGAVAGQLMSQVPDGTVCDANGGTCEGGTCQASSAVTWTYAYVSGTWGSCSKSCDTGTQTRTVRCEGTPSTGAAQYVDLSLCGSSPPRSSRNCNSDACPTYSWRSTTGLCSADCDGGTRPITSECINELTGVVVSDSLCPTPKPASSEACNKEVLCPTSWVYTEWSGCSVLCGGGLQTRVASCKKTRNGVTFSVTADECSTQADVESKLCNTNPCAAYDWVIGLYGDCDAVCGGGTQVRNVECRDTVSNTKAADNLCTNAKPDSSIECGTEPCYCHEWESTDWGECSVACGGGTRYRSVKCDRYTHSDYTLSDKKERVCRRLTGVSISTVADFYCTNIAKPLESEGCNTELCADYHYMIGTWGPCSKTCGGGTKQRDVICHNMALGATAPAEDESNCAGQTKPDALNTCNDQACPTYEWEIGTWGECVEVGNGCDMGEKARDVTCISKINQNVVAGAVADSLCEGEVKRTETCVVPEDVCVSDEGTDNTYAWVSAWSECSQACTIANASPGTRTRIVECVKHNVNGDSFVVSDDNCASRGLSKPQAEAENCNTFECGYYWETGQWSTCSKDCEYGSMNREVRCMTVDGREVGNLCTAAKPRESAECATWPCPAWTVLAADDKRPLLSSEEEGSGWGTCDAECGTGFYTREIQCLDWMYREVEEGFKGCVHSKPTDTQSCSHPDPCPHWHRNAYGHCDKPCGGGERTRTLTCREPHELPWNGLSVLKTHLCDGRGEVGEVLEGSKPQTVDKCNTQACSEYYYDMTWGECTLECGGGLQQGTARCVHSKTGQAFADSFCVGDPITQRSCNTHVCPTYLWRASKYSECTDTCGGKGKRYRDVDCVKFEGELLDGVVDDKFCIESGLGKPKKQEPCFETSNADCGEFGKCVDCDLEKGRCLCHNGYTGLFCDSPGVISDVRTDAADYGSAGVPPNDFVRIEWVSEGNFDRVDIVFVKYDNGAATDTVFTVATNVYNAHQEVLMTHNNTYMWNTEGSSDYLPAGEYRARVRATREIYSDSITPIYVGDPCAYLNCGLHGVCAFQPQATALNIGHTYDGEYLCKCLNGWSGPTCKISPCNRCNTAHATCDEAEGGKCRCKDGWTDEFCSTPPECSVDDSPFCQNGGKVVIPGVIEQEGQTHAYGCDKLVCDCSSLETFFQGATCGTCSLTCEHGSPNSECTQCVCEPSYTGRNCQCIQYSFKFTLKGDATSKMIDLLSKPSITDADAEFKISYLMDLRVDIAKSVSQDYLPGSPDKLPMYKRTTIEENHLNVVGDTLAAKVHVSTYCEEMSSFAGSRTLLGSGRDHGEDELEEQLDILYDQYLENGSKLRQGVVGSEIVVNAESFVFTKPDGSTYTPREQAQVYDHVCFGEDNHNFFPTPQMEDIISAAGSLTLSLTLVISLILSLFLSLSF